MSSIEDNCMSGTEYNCGANHVCMAEPGEEQQRVNEKGKKWLEPHEVDIGRLLRQRTTRQGQIIEPVKVLETEHTIQIGNGPVVQKQDLADICSCGRDDKCWATALCTKPWPLKLHLCNHAGEPGHENYDSDMHVFTKDEIIQIKEHVRNLIASENVGGEE